MGSFFTKIFDLIEGKKSKRMLMLGLDNAGKTTLLYQFKLGEIISTVPTIGFNVEEVEYKNINFTVFDVGGQEKLRPLWRHYYNGSDGLIYLIDSADNERHDESRDELHNILGDYEFPQSVPVLIFANKQDIPNAATPTKLGNILMLNKLKNPWYIQPCIANRGDGLIQGMEWLREQLNKQ